MEFFDVIEVVIFEGGPGFVAEDYALADSPCFKELSDDFWIPAGDFDPAALAPLRRACIHFCLEDIRRCSVVHRMLT